MNDQKEDERKYIISFHKIELLKNSGMLKTHEFVSVGNEELFVMKGVYQGDLLNFISSIRSLIDINENGIEGIHWEGMGDDIKKELFAIGNSISYQNFSRGDANLPCLLQALPAPRPEHYVKPIRMIGMDDALVDKKEIEEKIKDCQENLKSFILKFDEFTRIPLKKYLPIYLSEQSPQKKNEEWTKIKVEYGGKETILDDKTRMREFLEGNHEKLKNWEFVKREPEYFGNFEFFVNKEIIQNYGLDFLTGELFQFLRHHFNKFGDLSIPKSEIYSQGNIKFRDLMEDFSFARNCGDNYDGLLALDNSVEEQIRLTELCLKRPEIFIRRIIEGPFWDSLRKIYPIVIDGLEDTQKKKNIEEILNEFFGEEAPYVSEASNGKSAAEPSEPEKTQGEAGEEKRNGGLEDELYEIKTGLQKKEDVQQKSIKKTPKESMKKARQDPIYVAIEDQLKPKLKRMNIGKNLYTVISKLLTYARKNKWIEIIGADPKVYKMTFSDGEYTDCLSTSAFQNIIDHDQYTQELKEANNKKIIFLKEENNKTIITITA